jgi:hypothetical protein
MNSYITSLIRTWVPIAIGAVITWLATNYDILVPEDASSSLVVGVTALLIGAYYAVARLLEKRFPWLGKLLVGLGAGSEPAYKAPEGVQTRSGPAPY